MTLKQQDNYLRKLNAKQIAEMCEMFSKTRKSIKKIAEHFGVSRTTVYKVLAKHANASQS